MSDQTTDTTETAVEPAAVAAPEVAAAPSSPAPRRPRQTGGQTYVDRYLTPFLLPVIAVTVILFYVLNLSRALLAGTDTISVIVGVVVTVSILVGAATLSAAPKLRSQSLALITGISLLGLLLTGWLTVGNAQEEKGAGEVACAPVGPTFTVDAVSSPLSFKLPATTVKAGCVKFDYTGDAGHTLAWKPGGPTGPILHSDTSGPGASPAAAPGTYTFYCTVDSHAAAGMQATIKVTP